MTNYILVTMIIFETFQHLFLPHHTNNHRARILHPKGLSALIALIIFLEFSLGIVAKLRPDILGFATDISVDKLLSETNNKRLEKGISSLNLDGQLSQAAAGKANDMFAGNYWAHVSPGGKTPWDFIIGAGYSYVYAGENLAKDFQDSTSVVQAWMDSPTHRENLLQEKYQNVGFAVVNGRLEGEETTLVVQMFGTKTPGSTTQTQNTAPVLAEESPLPTVSSPTSTPYPIVINNLTPTIIPLANLENKNKGNSQVIAQNDIVVRQKPKIDLFNLSKNLITALIVLLMAVLIADAIIVSKKKIIRLTGDNFAHLLILTALLSALLVIGRGSIL